ncbi:aldo/keto reductase [Sporosarcina sp. Te-1]|uniref:aldo/keto reductase n=1 Tax=Sporosarcina sp. Te-1 TaxID=2818390 RepID=UPI001A9D52B4|nr:aldo/keto reductase [Sporosarcina sp. Te-1]QTD42228.1 aldo/keto reductase [Sporosarcina sp. Te-1]
MKKRRLGNSELYVSELGFGCMSLPQDKKAAEEIIEIALQAGINFFDTADLYEDGNNERLLGSLLAGHRDKLILATKVGNKMNPDGNSWSWDPSRQHIATAVKESLRRLQTDYIDLYQLHGGMMEDDVDETIDALESLKKEGLIRQYGISSIRPNVIERFLQKSAAVSVMMQYSLLDRRPEEWFSMISDFGASVITRGTLAKGFLTLDGVHRAEKTNGFGTYTANELVETLTVLNEKTEDIHASAIAFNLSNPAVSTVLVGASSNKQLLDSVVAYEEGADASVLQALQNAVKLDQYQEHRTEL